MMHTRLIPLVAAALLALSADSFGAISRVSGPTTLFTEGKGFVRFDAAFDTVNRVYLLVWGTQLADPLKGQFLNEAGNPISGIFPISAGPQHTGWGRVVYSAEQQKFLVSYTKIIGVNQHQKGVRFLAYAGGQAQLGTEVILDGWTGHAGTESGLAYSAPAGRFLVTWWRYSGRFPTSFAAALDGAGNVTGVHPLTSAGDGQSDPEIACDPVNRRCLVVGWSWGVLKGGGTALWGRFISDANAAPQGGDSFYLPTAGRTLEEPTVAFSAASSHYVIAYMSDGQIWGNRAVAASGAFSASYPLRVSSSATVHADGGGYGFPSLAYNAATQTSLLSTTPWLGFPSAQEIDSVGSPIAGALDFVPDPGHDFDFRNKYTIPVANAVSRQFLLLDNHFFKDMRVSRYSTTSGGGTPAPNCTFSLPSAGATFLASAGVQTLTVTASDASCAWTATSGASWITVTSGSSRVGTATVSYEVAANSTGADRTGTLTIAGQNYVVSQRRASRAAVHDLSGDGLSDLVWQHQGDGRLAAWALVGSVVTGTSPLSIPVVGDLGWKVVGSGDLSGDGYADLVWQHAGGHLAMWSMRGTTVLATRMLSIPSVSDARWRIRAVGDVDGNGKADIIWQHDLGALAVWAMDGHVVTATLLLAQTMPDPNWQIAGAGDINGDGTADLIWQNHATGWLGAWLLNGVTVVGQRALSIPAVADVNWKIQGVGDVNGDNFADLIWQNTATGQVAVWYLSGYTVIFQGNLSIPAVSDVQWRIAGPG